MHGQTCVICDRGNCDLSKRDWCNWCEEQFTQVMSTIKCAEDQTRHAASVCISPISCMMRHTCLQVTTAVRILRGENCGNEPRNGIAAAEPDKGTAKRASTEGDGWSNSG